MLPQDRGVDPLPGIVQNIPGPSWCLLSAAEEGGIATVKPGVDVSSGLSLEVAWVAGLAELEHRPAVVVELHAREGGVAGVALAGLDLVHGLILSNQS